MKGAGKRIEEKKKGEVNERVERESARVTVKLLWRGDGPQNGLVRQREHIGRGGGRGRPLGVYIRST